MILSKIKWDYHYDNVEPDLANAEEREWAIFPGMTGETLARSLIYADINENGADCVNYAIQIFEPSEFAGVYDAHIDYDPVVNVKQRGKK